jgi:hypothetical protein
MEARKKGVGPLKFIQSANEPSCPKSSNRTVPRWILNVQWRYASTFYKSTNQGISWHKITARAIRIRIQDGTGISIVEEAFWAENESPSSPFLDLSWSSNVTSSLTLSVYGNVSFDAKHSKNLNV